MGCEGNMDCTLTVLHWRPGKSNFASSQHVGSAAGLNRVQFRLSPGPPQGLTGFCWPAF